MPSSALDSKARLRAVAAINPCELIARMCKPKRAPPQTPSFDLRGRLTRDGVVTYPPQCDSFLAARLPVKPAQQELLATSSKGGARGAGWSSHGRRMVVRLCEEGCSACGRGDYETGDPHIGLGCRGTDFGVSGWDAGGAWPKSAAARERGSRTGGARTGRRA